MFYIFYQGRVSTFSAIFFCCCWGVNYSINHSKKKNANFCLSFEFVMNYDVECFCKVRACVLCVCRSCTDIICCVLFMLVIAGYIVVGILGKFISPFLCLSVWSSVIVSSCLCLSLIAVQRSGTHILWTLCVLALCLLWPESNMEIELGLP